MPVKRKIQGLNNWLRAIAQSLAIHHNLGQPAYISSSTAPLREWIVGRDASIGVQRIVLSGSG